MKFFGIWDRLLFRRLLGTILLFLISFFFIYVLIDFASRVSGMEGMRKSPQLLVRYYGAVFIKRLELLLPFALLLGTIRTLQILYRERGFVSALMTGTRLKRLLFPFYMIGFFSLLLLWSNEEWIVPRALKEINWIESLYFKQGGIGEIHGKIVVQTEEGGRLFFLNIEPYERTLQEVYYLPSWNKFFHMEFLDLKEKVPIGHFVDTFERKEEGDWSLIKRENILPIEQLKVVWDDLFGLVSQPNQFPLSTLIKKVQYPEKSSPMEKEEIATTLTKKILFPALPWLAILAVIPFGISFSRAVSFFSLYSMALFLFFSTYLSLSALLIPASPLLVVIPFSLLVLIIKKKHTKFART
jgi:lipopolysaccharide export system permease protein